tara:strand:+ start:2037 stop:2312 length:276 start_codon:yes stop_codon:yes gene_type:complete
MYQIKPIQRANAKKLLVDIKPSTNKGKKIDVFKNGKKIASIGAVGYSDYATYIKTKGLKYAKERKRLYRIRHDGEQKKVGSAGFYSFYILW